MSEKIQTISPTGKLNWDDSLELMPSGDCRERWHVEMSEVGKYGKLTNMRSDINWDISLGATEHVIGGCYDAKRDRYILVLSNTAALTTARFVYVQYKSTTPFYETGEIFEYNNFFENFTSSALATGTFVSCKMIDDIIITVDGVNENKAFDVVKCKKVNDGTIKSTALSTVTVDSGGSYPGYVEYAVTSVANFSVNDTVYIVIEDVNKNILYGGITTVYAKLTSPVVALICDIGHDLSDVNQLAAVGTVYKFVTNEDYYHAADDTVSMIIPTPRFAPEVKMLFDVENENSAIDVNYGVYQFAYSYVYFDNSESLLSPFSEETTKKELPLIDNTGESFNTIKLTLNIDRANIKKVRLYVRYIYKSVSNFYLIEEFQRENIIGNILTYDFYGNISSISTNNVDAFTVQDAVPYSSETVEIIKENVITLGGNTEGYEIIENNTDVDYFVDDTVDTMTLNSTLTNNAYVFSGQEVFGDKFNQIDSLTLTGITLTYSDHGYLYYRIYINGSVVKFVLIDRPLYSSFPGVYVAYAEWSTSDTTTTKTITELGSPLTGIGGSITVSKPSKGWTYTFGYIKTSMANTDKTSITITNTGEDNYYKISLAGLLAQNATINDLYIPMGNSTDANLATRIAQEINALTYAGLAITASNELIVAIEPDAKYATITISDYTKSNQEGYGGFIDDTTHLLVQNYYDKYGRLKYVSDVKKITIPYLTTALSLGTYGIDNTYIEATIKDNFPSDCETFSFSVAKPNKRWEQYPVYYPYIWAASGANTELDYAADPSKSGLYAIAIDKYNISIGLSGYTYQAGDQIRIVAYYDTLTYEKESATKYTPLIYRDVIKSTDILTDGSTVIFVDAAKIKAFIAASVDNEMTNVYESTTLISTGSTVDDAVYKIFDTDPDHFGTGLVIGDIFKSNGAISLNADNEVYPVCYYIFEIYRDYGNLDDTVVFTETSQRYLCSDYEIDEVIKIYDGTSFVLKNIDSIHTGLRFKTPIIYKDSTIDTRQYGKPLYRDDNSTIKYWNNVRNGGKAFQNTSVNNLFRFDALDVAYLNDNYGTIKGMAINGNTLRVYQERHNASIYIGGTEMANQDGEVQIIRSDKVLGSYRYSENNTYGLQCKTGMVNTGNDVYIWDLINGVIVKDSNGMMPIVGRVSVGEYSNDFKMERFFKEKSKLVTSKADFKVSLGYNRDNRVLFVSNSHDTSYPTICFSEEFGFWYQFLNIKPSFYLNGALGTIYSNAADDEIYSLFSDDNGRCEMTGVPSSFKFQVVANDNGKMKKVFEAISTQSSQAFDTVIEIEPTASYKYLITGVWKGMKSLISKGRYRLEEGIYRGDILKNMYPDQTNYRLYNGEVMRGSAALITFTETDADEAIEVLAVDVSYSDSSS